MKLVSFFKYKKIITNILIYTLIFYLLMNSKALISSIYNSTRIFLTKLMPALFPYLLITEFLINSGKIESLAYGLDKIISKIFHVPINTTACVIVGFLLGYPNAAKCILKLSQNRTIDNTTARKLVSFTSNANMSYIIATVGISIFKSIEIGIILAISHFLSAIIIGLIYIPSYNNSIIQQTNINSNSFEKICSPFELLYTSIHGTLKTLAYIFSYTIIFSLIPEVLIVNLNLPDMFKTILIAIFEISNGINNITLLNIPLNYKLILTSFILSFSSLMIIIQIYSFVFKAKVKFKELLKFKVLQGVISSVITYVIIQYIYHPTISVSFNMDLFNTTFNILPSTMYMFTLVITLIFSSILLRKKRQG